MGGDWKVVPDNLLIKVRGEDLDERSLREAIDHLRDVEFWENDKLWAEVATSLPNYRLSKFQAFMPPWVEREVVAAYLLDVEGAWRWVSRDPDAAPLRGVAEALASAGRPRARDHVPEREPEPLDLSEPEVRGDLPVRWITNNEELISTCELLQAESVVGLDVETTLGTQALCLVQVACEAFVALIDPLEDLRSRTPWRGVGRWAGHQGDPQRRLREEGAWPSRLPHRQRGRHAGAVAHHASRAEGGHSLRVVCQRELGLDLDKTQQTTDWMRRPLTPRQVAYAALDAEVLLRLHDLL